MKIGIEFIDYGFSSLDLSNIRNGNPGCGGTQYEFVMLASHLLDLDPNYEIFFFHFNNNKLDCRINSIIVKDLNEIPEKEEASEEVIEETKKKTKKTAEKKEKKTTKKKKEE